MDKAHDIQSISFMGTIMHLRVDGRDYDIAISQQSDRLAAAALEQKS